MALSRRIAVIGAGGWGTALAVLLAGRATLWVRRPELAKAIHEHGENREYLPGVPVPKSVLLTCDPAEAVHQAGIVLLAGPSQYVRKSAGMLAPYLTPGAILVSAAKGLELESWKRMSEVIAEEIPGSTGRIAVLSGPNHAEEVGRGVPSATVVASDSPDAAREVREAFGSLSFRVYTSPDLVGVELGGAFKNIIALACGIAEGLGLGDNTRAALMTRGLAEVARLGVAMGGRAETFAGLSGVGDLIVTCTSGFSRNRRAGVAIGRGRSLAETLEETRMVVEGVFATQAARALSELYQVEMPIARETYAVLFEGKNPQAAVRDLMIRPPADEITWLEEVPPARRPS